MLASLHIENIAVIKKLDLTFDGGFTVLSGETGAGKSVILDSLNFLLGSRMAKDLVRTGESRAAVSAVFTELPPAVIQALGEMGFEVGDDGLMLSRTLSAEGRSVTRLDGQVITGAMQKEIGRLLFNIHGQNDNQKLLQKSSHAAILDAYAHNESCREAYRAAYDAFTTTREALRAVNTDAAAKERLKSILAFQIKEISAAKLKPGEEAALTRERDKLANIEKIAKQTRFTYHALVGSEKSAAYLLDRAAASLRQVTSVVPEMEELAGRLDSCRFELEDVAETVRDMGGDGAYDDPTAALTKIESRLDTISRLEKKYGTDEAAVIAFKEDAVCQYEELENADARVEELSEALGEAERALCGVAETLRESRRAAAAQLRDKVCEVLRFLDMPKVHFDVRIEPLSGKERFHADGGDDVEFLISTNPGEPLLPMIRIASGGELSRIMLAIRSVLSDSDGVPTVIFDEVDTGVSGKTSRKIGIKLKEIARGAQVLCVTHSAQIASLADHHYHIFKEEVDGRAQTGVKVLNEEERVEELARILGGIHVTDAQRQSARELMREDWLES